MRMRPINPMDRWQRNQQRGSRYVKCYARLGSKRYRSGAKR